MNLLPPKLSRYAAVAALLMKYGRANVPEAGVAQDEKPEALARDLEALGPTFVKLGNRALDSLAASELKLKVELIDEGAIIGGLQKVANRITLGLLLASLIVGGSMIMSVETPVRVFGYPALAMTMLLLAGAGAAYLAIQIVRHDRTPKTR